MTAFRARFTARRIGSLLVTGIVSMPAACSGSDDDGRDARNTLPANATSTEASSGASVSASAGTTETPPDDQRFPDVVGVAVTGSGGTYTFEVTISSAYDTPERYADGWRIVGPDDTVYGEHELTHDHATEQPFTRTQTGVQIPDGVDEVVVEGRDLANGYGGETQTVTLPDR